jgi:hypothetical protein
MNTDRMKRDEKGASKYKTVNKLIRNEDMTRAEACETVKGMEANVLGPARNTRNPLFMSDGPSSYPINPFLSLCSGNKKRRRSGRGGGVVTLKLGRARSLMNVGKDAT